MATPLLNATTLFWQNVVDESSTATVVTIFSSVLSFTICIAVGVMYAKKMLRHSPAGEVMMVVVFGGALAALNFGTSAFLRTYGSPEANRIFCDMCGNLIQVVYTPLIMCEAVFFLVIFRGIYDTDEALAQTNVNGTSANPLSLFARKVMGLVLMFSLFFAVAVWITLPEDPVWQSRFFPYINGWCWVPASTSAGVSRASFDALRGISFAISCLSFAISAGCLFWIRRILIERGMFQSRCAKDAGDFIQSRLLFMVLFIVTFAVQLLDRFGVEVVVMAPMQSFVQPFLPAANALLFAIAEWKGSHSDELANELTEGFGMAVVDVAREVPQEIDLRYDEENDVWLVAKKDTQEVLDPTLRAHAIAKLFNVNLHVERYFIAGALSFQAGYCDCCGFLALDLFTAHVTGNFATIGMALKENNFSSIGLKIAGLVIFLAGIVCAHATTAWAGKHHGPFLMIAQTLLLFVSFVGAVTGGPFATVEEKKGMGAYITGLSMVAAMSFQNVYQRKYLVGLPMTTNMTGNTLSVMMELWNIILSKGKQWVNPAAAGTAAAITAAWRTMRNNLLAIAAYVAGCIAVTAMTIYEKQWAFMVAPILPLLILLVAWNDLQPAAKTA